MSSTLLRVACATLVAISGTAVAAESLNVRPGEWEFTQTMTASGAPIYIEQFTAAQRAEYAKSWAKDAGKPSTSNDKQCISEKDIKEATLFKDMKQEGKTCTESTSKQSRTQWTAVVECKDAKTSTRTSVDYTAPSPDRLIGVLKSSTTSPNGVTVLDFKFSGKWVAARCSEEDADSDSEEENRARNRAGGARRKPSIAGRLGSFFFVAVPSRPAIEGFLFREANPDSLPRRPTSPAGN